MAESVLSKLVKTDKETKEHLESIDSNLLKVYKLQLKTEKREAKQAKREAQRKKRSGGDFLQNLALPEKDKKKARKGFLESIGEFFKSIGGFLLKGLGGLMGPLFKMGGPIANIITGAFKTIFNPRLLRGIGTALGGVLKNPIFWKAALVTALGIGATKLFGQAKSTLDKKRGVTDRGTRFSGQDMEGLAKKEAQGYTFDAKTKEYINIDGKVDNAMTTRQAIYRSLQKDMQKYGVAEMNIQGAQQNLRESRGHLKRERDTQNRRHVIERYEREIQHSLTIIQMFTKQMETYDKKIKTKIKKLNLADEDIVNFQLSQGRRNPDLLPANIDRSKIDFSNIGNPLTNQFTFTDYGDHAVKKQSGGPLTVPGSGSGDKVPMMLPEGSFVMNRNAAQMGYQTGGIPKFQSGGMIPTLLEPGEHVYAPGQWNASHVLMNNSIPRFQSGGYVGVPKSQLVDTGYKDKHGRPILLSPGAAKGFKDMVAAGMPMNSGDVTSVHRDEAEYNAILQKHLAGVPGYGRPAANSHHNHGNAADIHGAMNQWIRSNGAQYGWHAHDYKGTHGGHFEYRGPGSQTSGTNTNTNTNPNQDGGAGDQGSKRGGGGILSGLMNVGGEFGEFLKHVASSFAGLGGELQGLGQGLFGGLGFGGGGNDLSTTGNDNGGPRSITGTGPVDMGADVNQKLLNVARLAMAAGFTKEQAKVMAAIAGGESTFDNMAHNGNRATGDNSYGLWQINMIDELGPERRRMIGISSNEELFDPAVNARAAKLIFDRQGYGAWGAYKDGNAAKYMNAAQALQLARGGRVSRTGQPNTYQMSMQHSLRRHLGRSRRIHVMPQIEPSRPSSNANPGAQNQPPVLDVYPTNVVAMDLAYRTSIGGVF